MNIYFDETPTAADPAAFDFKRQKAMFRRAEQAHHGERKLAFRDEDYYHNFDDDQWSADEKQTLAERGQPTYTHNRIKRKVNFLMGMEQRSRTDPKALPRKPRSEMMAEVATDILSAIDDKTGFDQISSRAFFSLLVSGLTACEDVWNPAENRIDCTFIPFEEFFRDPRAKHHDFTDARYLGYAKWFDLDEALQTFNGPDQVKRLKTCASREESQLSGYDDRPGGNTDAAWETSWAITQNKQKRVRIVTMYYRGGDNLWRLSQFCGAGGLNDQLSPWRDGDGRPACGITAESLYVDRENRRYGVVRDMIGPQQEDNHYRAKIWHHANDKRFWYTEGTFGDFNSGSGGLTAAKAEMAKADGAIKVNNGFPKGEDWDFVPAGDQVQMLSGLLAAADADLARQGPNNGMTGRGAAAQSGRARLLQQQAGQLEENNAFDRLYNWKRRSFVRKFDLARQFWRAEDFIRISDAEDGPRFVAINEKTYGPDGAFLGIKNDMARLDVDIVIEEVPDIANVQAEQFELIARILSMGVPPAYLAALVATSQLRDKAQLIKAITAGPDPAQQQATAMARTAAEMQIRKTMAETEKLKADAALIRAKAEDAVNGESLTR